MEVILSGGNFGGEIVIWETDGILDDGREYMNIDGFLYALSSGSAVFCGMA